MATKKKSIKRRRSASKKPRRVVVKKTVVVRIGSRKSRRGGIAKLKSRIRGEAENRLKDGLYARDRATTAKQHRAAQKKIDSARSDLRRYK